MGTMHAYITNSCVTRYILHHSIDLRTVSASKVATRILNTDIIDYRREETVMIITIY